MLPIERVINRLQGKPTDRVPFAPLTSLFGTRLISCPLDQYYTNPVSYFQGQKAVVESIEPDILFSPFALVMEAEAFGSKAAYFEKNPPNLKIPAVTGFEEIKNLIAPDIENNPKLAYLIESTRLLVEYYKNQIPVAAIVSSPTELPALIMGIENWIDTLLFHPSEAQQMINLCSEYFVSFANTMLSLGAACIIFRKEIEHLTAGGKLSGEYTFLDSELHMEPKKLEQVIEKLIKPGCLVCYGDCHARMAEQEMNGELSRIAGLNCVEIFLGRETYRKLRREGAFFLLPEWTHKWERIFKELLGFSDQKVAVEFMNEMHTRFIYVNTGVNKVPNEVLSAISAYFALPVEILDIDLIHLENAIKNGLKQMKDEG